MKQEETQKWSKLFYSLKQYITLRIMNIVLESYKLIMALPSF